MSRTALLALAGSLACASCSGRVSGLGDEQPLLATLRVRLEGGLLGLPSRMRVGVLWTGVPAYVPYCHDYGYTPLDPERDVPDTAFYGCRSPFDVVPSLMGPSVAAPVSATTDTFEIPLRQVPPASVMVGEPGRRLAYGTLVMFDDQNGNGDLDFAPRCGGPGGPGSGRADAGAAAGDAGADAGPADAGDVPERMVNEQIWGASFDSLLEPQLRVVYREGELDRGSFFYPAPAGCTAEPPVGFSLWRVDPLLDADGSCAVVDLAEPARLPFERPTTAAGLRCRDSDRSTFPRELSERTAKNALEGGRVVFDCLPDGTIAIVDKQCTCPEVRTYPLAGCRDEVNCPVPEWDLRANPPAWWPCPVVR